MEAGNKKQVTGKLHLEQLVVYMKKTILINE